jgi:aryl sulfotransferase
MHHNQSWWDFRHLDNILFLHYAEMLTGPAAEIRRIADFLEIAIDDRALDGVVAQTSLPAMRQRALAAEQTRDRPESFRGGARTFFNKGVNGRWRGVLSEEELAMYEQTRDRVLSPDCARWLEEGSQALLGV